MRPDASSASARTSRIARGSAGGVERDGSGVSESSSCAGASASASAPWASLAAAMSLVASCQRESGTRIEPIMYDAARVKMSSVSWMASAFSCWCALENSHHSPQSKKAIHTSEKLQLTTPKRKTLRFMWCANSEAVRWFSQRVRRSATLVYTEPSTSTASAVYMPCSTWYEATLMCSSARSSESTSSGSSWTPTTKTSAAKEAAEEAPILSARAAGDDQSSCLPVIGLIRSTPTN
mmetsp:Transcript_40109/g.110416  ORF Transcript_40109/g.110416 Transcript_40109/m.110416 type:complete len:236 (+) Transcript_40109:1033-1740(+)